MSYTFLAKMLVQTLPTNSKFDQACVNYATSTFLTWSFFFKVEKSFSRETQSAYHTHAPPKKSLCNALYFSLE